MLNILRYKKRKSTVAFLGFLMTLLSLTPFTSTVYATSDFDGAWRHTTDVSLESPSCGVLNKASEITAQLESNSGWPSTAERDYYHAITSGSTPGFISLTKTHQVGTNWTWVSLYVQQGTDFDAIWTGSTGDGNGHHIRIPGPSFGNTAYSGQWIGFMLDDSTCDMTFVPIGGTSVAFISTANDATTFSQENIDLVFANGAYLRPHYPAGYAGVDLGSSSADTDGDGLTEAQEFRQNTSDGNKDTDGDGIDDMTESLLNIHRDEQFCDTSTPKNCTYPYPTIKDLFVEVDWVNNGTRNYKPSQSQLDDVSDALTSQNIIPHFDTGQYGGGGEIDSDLFSNNDNNALIFAPSENEDSIDFYDLKNGSEDIPAYFSSARKGVWHYMITSPIFKISDTDNDLDRTGVSYPGDDDSVVSIGRIEDLTSTGLDTAIAGTVLHELGHNLCLSGTASVYYPNQPAACVYGEIDKDIDDNPSTDYMSVMNYRHQLDMIDYSHGFNGAPGDHDDWSAIKSGMGDFANSVFEWSNFHYRSSNSTGQANQLSREQMVEALQD